MVRDGGAAGSGGDGGAGGGPGVPDAGGGCGRIAYQKPGCGSAAEPICDEGAGGACASPVCGCDGKVRVDACGESSAPFAYFLSSNGGSTTCDPNLGAGGGTGAGGVGGAGGACERILYAKPGCGAKAVPVCVNGPGGACGSPVCGCDGKVRVDGCSSSTAPFSYFLSGNGGSTTCDPNAGAGGQGGMSGG